MADAFSRVPVGARSDTSEVGLADNGGLAFQCGTCEYFDDGVCRNVNPKIKDRPVQAAWCCNLYDHEGMHVIV